MPVALILFFVVSQGIQSLNVNFFTHMPAPVGEAGGGMANAIVGTLILIGIASAVGLPVGMAAGLYLTEKRSTLLAILQKAMTAERPDC